MTRILHTSDWHLGRRLCEQSLIEDQAHALDQVVAACRAERVDAVVVAGDVYDRAIPPEEAVSLLSDVLDRVANGLGVPVIAISGNHDSPERLGFGAAILAGGRVHFRTSFARRVDPVVVGGGSGRERVAIYGLPYLEPDVARAGLSDDSIATHDAAVRGALAAAREHRAKSGVRDAIVVAHLFAQGGVESRDSERPILGGAGLVAPDALEGWTYVALGHLHAPQEVAGRDAVRYSGSLLKYSFGEAAHVKGMNVVEIEGGRATVRSLPIRPRRDLARIRGTFEELRSDPRFEAARESYVEATWTDREYVVDVAARLRERFPHLLLAVPQALIEGDPDAPQSALPEAGRAGDARGQLTSFWKHVGAEELGPLEETHVAAFEDALKRAERGVSARETDRP